jgi:hypothetical protein
MNKDFRAESINLKRMGRYFCDKLPTALCLVDLQYRPAVYYDDPGYFIEIMYKNHKFMFVYGVNIGHEVVSDESLDIIMMAFLNKSRKMCLDSPEIATAHLDLY